MSVEVKKCLEVNKSTCIGPFDEVNVLKHGYKVRLNGLFGICSADDADEILEIEWDSIDDCEDFYRPWKGSLCCLYDLDGTRILALEWRHITVKPDCIIALDANNREHWFNLDGSPFD